MVDVHLRGELWDNDSADILRWWGWRDITAPMDIQAALEAAGGDEVTVLINSPGGNMAVGTEIRSMLRRYPGRTTALFQSYGASAATLAATGCQVIRSEPGALLCYHKPSGGAEGDHRAMSRAAEDLRNARDCILEVYTARGGTRSREELIALMDQDIYITPTQAREYGHTRRRELSYLVVHSALHLLGYDHLDEGPQKAQMRAREEAILAQLGITRE